MIMRAKRSRANRSMATDFPIVGSSHEREEQSQLDGRFFLKRSKKGAGTTGSHFAAHLLAKLFNSRHQNGLCEISRNLRQARDFWFHQVPLSTAM